MATQRKWLYLEGIFVGGDIRSQLPEEAKKFDDIDKSFRKVTILINSHILLSYHEGVRGEHLGRQVTLGPRESPCELHQSRMNGVGICLYMLGGLHGTSFTQCQLLEAPPMHRVGTTGSPLSY